MKEWPPSSALQGDGHRLNPFAFGVMFGIGPGTWSTVLHPSLEVDWIPVRTFGLWGQSGQKLADERGPGCRCRGLGKGLIRSGKLDCMMISDTAERAGRLRHQEGKPVPVRKFCRDAQGARRRNSCERGDPSLPWAPPAGAHALAVTASVWAQQVKDLVSTWLRSASTAPAH